MLQKETGKLNKAVYYLKPDDRTRADIFLHMIVFFFIFVFSVLIMRMLNTKEKTQRGNI